MKKTALALAAVFVLTACDTPTMSGTDKVEYTLPPKIGLDVQSISFVNLAAPERAATPFDGDEFQPTIPSAVRKWASDRLQATGRTGEAVVTVKEASMVTEAIPTETGIDKIFTRQQASKDVGHVVVTIEVRKEDNYAAASAEASRWVSIPDSPTHEELKTAYYTTLNGLMKDLGQNLETSLHAHMNGLITVPVADPLTVSSTPSSAPAAK